MMLLITLAAIIGLFLAFTHGYWWWLLLCLPFIIWLIYEEIQANKPQNYDDDE